MKILACRVALSRERPNSAAIVSVMASLMTLIEKKLIAEISGKGVVLFYQYACPRRAEK